SSASARGSTTPSGSSAGPGPYRRGGAPARTGALAGDEAETRGRTRALEPGVEPAPGRTVTQTGTPGPARKRDRTGAPRTEGPRRKQRRPKAGLEAAECRRERGRQALTRDRNVEPTKSGSGA